MAIDSHLVELYSDLGMAGSLRLLEIDQIKSLQHVPMSHRFVERLIGTIRRELLDHTFFWAATDLVSN